MEENIEQEVEILNRMSPELSRVFGTQDLEGVLDIDIKFGRLKQSRNLAKAKGRKSFLLMILTSTGISETRNHPYFRWPG